MSRQLWFRPLVVVLELTSNVCDVDNGTYPNIHKNTSAKSKGALVFLDNTID